MVAHAVLSNYELLERVLLHLPLRSLLLAQRINKACFDVVQRSETIHCALFWKASAAPIGCLKEWTEDLFASYEHWHYKDAGQTVQPPIINPFISFTIKKAAKSSACFAISGESGSIPGALICTYDPMSTKVEAATSRDDMLLTHPPLYQLGLDMIPESGADDAKITLKSEDGAGWTYDMLCERGPPAVELEAIDLGRQWEFFVEEAWSWKRVANVDATTGFEMLEMLENPKALKGEVMSGGGVVYGDNEDGSEYWSSEEED